MPKIPSNRLLDFGDGYKRDIWREHYYRDVDGERAEITEEQFVQAVGSKQPVKYA